jgi:hypothetical protein
VTIQQLIYEQKTRMRSTNPAERLAAALLIPALLADRLRLLSDREIAQLMLDEVLPLLTPLHPDSTICLHAVSRLRNR